MFIYSLFFVKILIGVDMKFTYLEKDYEIIIIRKNNKNNR